LHNNAIKTTTFSSKKQITLYDKHQQFIRVNIPSREQVQKENIRVGERVVAYVLDVLEPVSQRLKEREEARELSKVDMMLDSMNIAGHFPELAEAISRLLENNTYVGIRLEKIIGKLKSGLKENGEPKNPEVPSIDMNELSAPANPESLNPKEKELFEVSEEQPPKAEVPRPEAKPEVALKPPELPAGV